LNWATINLNELLAQIWPLLERASQEAGNPLRTPVFGTANELEISLRTVVLRQVQPASRELVCHTDYRARKSWEIRKNPQVRWLFYHPGEQIQIRAGGTAILHQNNDVARAAWERTPLPNRRNYGTPLAPGTRLPSPDASLPAGWKNGLPTLDESEIGWPNFAVVVTAVDQLEWLHLRPEGHRRAGFTWVGDHFSGHWLVP
jgi:pyridoxamine 5'-phosphate oxidase